MCMIKSNWHWLCPRFDFKVFLVLLSISFSVALSPNLLPGVCGRTSLLPFLCHQAADGERPHWLHHRRGALFAQWGQAHQTTDWLQDTGKGDHLPMGPRAKRGHFICSQGQEEGRGGSGLSLPRRTCHKVVIVTLDMHRGAGLATSLPV